MRCETDVREIERTRKGGGKRCGVGEKRGYENFLVHLKEMRNEGASKTKEKWQPNLCNEVKLPQIMFES